MSLQISQYDGPAAARAWDRFHGGEGAPANTEKLEALLTDEDKFLAFLLDYLSGRGSEGLLAKLMICTLDADDSKAMQDRTADAIGSDILRAAKRVTGVQS